MIFSEVAGDPACRLEVPNDARRIGFAPSAPSCYRRQEEGTNKSTEVPGGHRKHQKPQDVPGGPRRPQEVPDFSGSPLKAPCGAARFGTMLGMVLGDCPVAEKPEQLRPHAHDPVGCDPVRTSLELAADTTRRRPHSAEEPTFGCRAA